MTNKIHPISFAIPSEKLVPNVTTKTRWVAHLIPQKRFEPRKTYIYQTEKSYYEDYQCSVFALTKKKAGWDCLRHYEILAQGCLPYFPDLGDCPATTMTHLPKDKIMLANKYHKRWLELDGKESDSASRMIFASQKEIQLANECLKLSLELLEYTKQNLTTEKMASYVLNIIQENNPHRHQIRSVLLMHGTGTYKGPDYMRDLTLHGLKCHLKSKCHESPKVPFIYNDFSEEESKKLYGKGFTYSRNLEAKEMYNGELEKRIMEDIQNHEYDIIMYSHMHERLPHYDLVRQVYKASEIVLLCGQDRHNGTLSKKFADRGHVVFVREL